MIAFLAMSDEYERTSLEDPTQGRVLSIDDGIVRYERYSPGSPWDEDGDGWIGPYTEDGVPYDALGSLAPGAPLELRGGELELARSAPTKALLVGFALSLLLALYFGFRPMLARRELRRVAGDPIAVIKLMLRRSRRTSLFIGLLMLSMGTFIAGVAFAPDTTTTEAAFLVGLGGISALISLPSFKTVWTLRDVARAPVLRAILEEPDRIVWLYERVVVVNGVSQYNLFVGFADGERFDFHLADTPAAPLVEALRARLPHAIVGYDEHREAQWQKAPGEFLLSARG